MRSFLLITALLSVAMLCGCATSPQPMFYTLSPERPQERMESGTSVVIAIGPVEMPEIVDRPQLVLRVNETQVKLDEFARWAEPLKRQIPSVIAANLTQIFPDARISSYPQLADQAAYQVSVNVLSFESVPGDAAAVTVQWSVRQPKKGAPQLSGRSVVRELAGAPGYDALVAAHSRALAAVSRDIAAVIHSAVRQ